MAIFSQTQDGGCRHLVFAKMMIFATLSTTGCHSAPSYQNWWKSAYPWSRNGTLIKFTMAVAAILNFG